MTDDEIGTRISARSAFDYAEALVAGVRNEPSERLALLQTLYTALPGRPELHLPYSRAAMAFMNWQFRRGLLNPSDGHRPGSPWWQAVNERLLRDTAEARGLVLGLRGPPSSVSAELSYAFARRPSARSWYGAHNASILSAYLEHSHAAEEEGRVERFFINLVLIRLLYAHALVAAPRLALSWLHWFGPLLGDPRVGVTAIFLSFSRVLPNRYPLRGDLSQYVNNEGGFGRLLDVGLVLPRLQSLYSWSADELGLPAVTGLLRDRVPVYAWDPGDSEPWSPPAGRLVGIARRLIRSPS